MISASFITETVRRMCLGTFLPAVFLSFTSLTAQIRSVNEGWRFSFGTDTTQTAVHLPHCWNTDAYSTTAYRRGIGTYRRTIRIPENFTGKRIYLRLDGAANRSEISVNGHMAGAHIGGYSPHLADITDHLTPGSGNNVVISVDNADHTIPPYSADFTSMGGLYRDAWLIAVPQVHLQLRDYPACGFRSTVSALPDGNWQLQVTGHVANTLPRDAEVTVDAILTDSNDNPVAQISTAVDAAAGTQTPFSIGMTDISVTPWSPENPTLYTLTVTVTDRLTKESHTGRSDVGFRTFGFDDNGRFLLNGTPYKLRGMCRHQDQAPHGIALTDEQHRRDIRLIKESGANFIRISHYPQDDAILEMCDRLGLIAWEEIPVIDYVPDNEEFASNCHSMLRDMIRWHYNHPSIAMWGYMNEILLRTPAENQDSTYSRTLRLAHALEQTLHQEDTTRLSTMAFHGSDIYHRTGLADITGVKGWNLYQGWYGGELYQFDEFLDREHTAHPSHRIIVSEYGAGSDLRLHSLTPEPFDFSTEYQQKYLEHYLPAIESRDYIAGASHWNFIDFSSANRAEAMPHINNKGLVTNDRRKKDVFYFYKASWHNPATDTVVHIATRDWPVRTELAGPADTVVRPIKIYTNLPEICLRVNGTMLPSRKTVNSTAIFDTPLKCGMNILEAYPDRMSTTPCDVTTVTLTTLPVKDGMLCLGPEAELAVNVGSNCYFTSDASGLAWLPDRVYRAGGVYGHTGGERIACQDEIALTDDLPLLQRAVAGLDEYRIDVADGEYEVELLFAELASPSAVSAYLLGRDTAVTGQPVTSMSILINGQMVEDSFSPAEEAGTKTMVKKRYRAIAADGGGITVRFQSPDGAATSLSAIKIRNISNCKLPF